MTMGKYRENQIKWELKAINSNKSAQTQDQKIIVRF